MRFFPAVVLSLLLLAAAQVSAADRTVLRVGHFPNVTHAQALIARNLARHGKGWFEERLGPDVEIQWFVFNAGPSAMEAFFAKSIDLTYVGPSPAINAYFRSNGAEVRVIAGAVNGGAALVAREDAGIKTPADFRGKRIATPQLGNTQDVACRAWLKAQGFKITQIGGDVLVVPTANPDLLPLFKRGELAGAWTVEPWVSQLEMEAGGKISLEEKDAVITLLASRTEFLNTKRNLVKKFAAAHAELTEWIKNNPDEAQRLVRDELRELTKRDLPQALVERAWPRLVFSAEAPREALKKSVDDAKAVGFLRGSVDLSRLVEIP